MNIQIQNQFYVIRHGKADNNEAGIVSCKLKTQNQYGLIPDGHEVVSREAELHTSFDVIYSSPFRRTEETALCFAKTSNCEVILDERLREFDVGDLDLKPSEQFSIAMKEHTECHYQFPNGESLSDVLDRLIDFVTEINSQNIHKKVLLVTHGVPAEILVDWWSDIPLRKWEECIEKGKVFPLES